MKSQCGVRCIDLATGKELGQTEHGRDSGVTTLDISPDGRMLASGSGYEDPTIRVWDAATDGYSRLPENLLCNEVLPLDHSRLLLLPPSKPPELVDLKRDSPPVSLPKIGSSTNVLGCCGTNIL